jgi:hypothetical protein
MIIISWIRHIRIFFVKPDLSIATFTVHRRPQKVTFLNRCKICKKSLFVQPWSSVPLAWNLKLYESCLFFLNVIFKAVYWLFYVGTKLRLVSIRDTIANWFELINFRMRTIVNEFTIGLDKSLNCKCAYMYNSSNIVRNM